MNYLVEDLKSSTMGLLKGVKLLHEIEIYMECLDSDILCRRFLWMNFLGFEMIYFSEDNEQRKQQVLMGVEWLKRSVKYAQEELKHCSRDDGSYHNNCTTLARGFKSLAIIYLDENCLRAEFSEKHEKTKEFISEDIELGKYYYFEMRKYWCPRQRILNSKTFNKWIMEKRVKGTN